ncbi:unnamed protein product [Paramecium octaurelia]|uniref:Uncharacterized protein n=1 Tax=Paramecium octaurelia TaxID=43137 RepID=A0A8S1SZ99_PAROT|nr:unnamed protein product [Paramecium octaurelia]
MPNSDSLSISFIFQECNKIQYNCFLIVTINNQTLDLSLIVCFQKQTLVQQAYLSTKNINLESQTQTIKIVLLQVQQQSNSIFILISIKNMVFLIQNVQVVNNQLILSYICQLRNLRYGMSKIEGTLFSKKYEGLND